MLLAVNGIEVIYNRVILVLKGVSLAVPEGGIVAILGANGAGKTTTLRAISNLLRGERGEVTKGSVEYRGEKVHHLSPSDLVKRGVIQVMEGRHCFGHLSIEENLLTGAYTRKDGKAAVAETLDKVYAYFPRLKTRRSSQAAAALPLQRSGLAQYLCQTVYGQTHNIVITSHNAAAPQRSMALDGVSPGFVIRFWGCLLYTSPSPRD